MVRYAERALPALASYLGRSSASLAQNRLTVVLPAGSLASSFATPENQEALQEMAAELWGPGLTLLLQASAEAEPPPERRARAEAQAKAAAELADHPAVRQATEIFEAEVVALNPLEAEPEQTDSQGAE